MNIQEYISSGIVEAYVLGMTSPEEAEEFERMCAAHAEVRNARDSFEQQLERNAIAVGVQPPKKLKSLILSEIEIDAQKLSPKKVILPESENLDKLRVIKLTPAFWKYAAAAAIILLVVSTFLNIYFVNQYRETRALYTQLLASNNQLVNEFKVVQARAGNLAAAFEMANDTNMAVVKMEGVKGHEGNRATVYWNKRTKDVYLMLTNLPQPAAGKQYQLWAIVDGKPVDAGMVDYTLGNMRNPMKNIPSAQAFAITLEKEGGSPTPDMEAMFVMGGTI